MRVARGIVEVSMLAVSSAVFEMARMLDAVNRKRGQQATRAPIASLSRPLPMNGISITYKEVGALSFASRLIPERTPKRW
jgi:hypothetical protein